MLCSVNSVAYKMGMTDHLRSQGNAVGCLPGIITHVQGLTLGHEFLLTLYL